MSTMSTVTNKISFKYIEVPLNKFKEVIPHHQEIFKQHKSIVLKLASLNKINELNQEICDKKKVIKQLNDLLYELDTLRAQVNELDKFDQLTFSFRKDILFLRNGYDNLEKLANDLKYNEDYQCDNIKVINPFEGASEIQMQEKCIDIKLKYAENTLDTVENIYKDVEDLHQVYTQLNEIVDEQKQTINNVEEIIESTNKNVSSGSRHLVKAYKLKSAAYPITGAFLGSVIGGPIGLIAGFKIGGIAALTCAIAGYTGGILFKNKIQEPKNLEGNIIESNNCDKKKDD